VTAGAGFPGSPGNKNAPESHFPERSSSFRFVSGRA
jgi:hypothetical protein